MDKFFVVLVSVLLLVSFATNPSYDDFKHEYKAQVMNDLGTRNNNGFVDLLVGSVADKSLNVFYNNYVQYKDYKFFSIVTVKEPGKSEVSYLGFLNKFHMGKRV